MKRWMIGAAMMAAIVGLLTLVQLQPRIEPVTAARAEVPDEEGWADWKLIVAGEPIENLIIQREDMRAVLLEVLGGEYRAYSDEELEELLVKGKESNLRDLPEALTGIPGLPALQLLQAYVASLAEQEFRVRGKIRHYYFNKASKGGYLEVDTVVEILQDGSVIESDTFFWAIAVLPGKFEVRKSEWQWPDPDNPDAPPLQGAPQFQPFPGTLDLPTEAFEDIWQRRLRYKLWAEGEGIVVVGIRWNGIQLPPDEYPEWYESKENSCIDIMFEGHPPEHGLPPQPDYCLGRCKHPVVVNTV